MRTILKRFVKKDCQGRILTTTSERLVDDGNGRIYLLNSNTFANCPTCNRLITDISDLKGRCQNCFANVCCSHCLSQCQLCLRFIGPYCKRGFAGQTQITVCPVCLNVLNHRQALQDKIAADKTNFERQIIIQRERIKLLQSGVLRQIPGGKTLSTLGQLAVMKRLRQIEQDQKERTRQNARYLI